MSKKKIREKPVGGVYFKPYKPWAPLIPFTVPPEALASNVVACFQNHLVTVFVKQTMSDIPSPEGGPSRMVHLMMVWSDASRKEEIPYRFKQQVKRELCSEQSEAVELFPADWREQDMVQTHLWVLPPGAVYPIGIVPTDMEGAIADVVGGRENLVTKEELEVFVVRHLDDSDVEGQGVLEVFASEEECLEQYGKNGNNIPESSKRGIEMIGDVPAEGEGVAWSDRAKVKVSNVLAKARAIDMSRDAGDVPELFYEHYTVEDDIFEEEYSSSDPVGDEEHIAIAIAMEEALLNRADERAAQVREVTESVIGRAGDNIVSSRELSLKPKIFVPK